jgi:hypothetical protein
LLKELGYNQETVILHEDNEACINLTKNPQEYKRTRHIQVKYHFIRKLVQAGKIKLQYCKTQDQLADILTKGVNGPRLLKISEMLGLKDNSKHGRELEYAKNCRGGTIGVENPIGVEDPSNWYKRNDDISTIN